MHRALYIGHAFHLKTKSTQFFIKILQERFDVSFLWYDPYTTSYTGLESSKGQFFDVIVIFQILLDTYFLNQNFKFKKAFFVPMYDGVASLDGVNYSLFEPYRDFGIISFSKTIYEGLIKLNYKAIYIKYFPEPEEVNNWGKLDSVFFWQRIDSINIRNIVRLLPKIPIKHIHIHKALDPMHSFVSPNIDSKYTYTYSEWFENKQEMNQILDNSAIYIAPRYMEGIGQSFLGAMARGRCVIAPDVPTMNEYIIHGENGILYDFKSMPALENQNIRLLQRNALKTIKDGYENWQRDKKRLQKWLEKDDVQKEQMVVVITYAENLYINHSKNEFIRTLESVRIQNHKKIRHIVINTSSSDNTGLLLKKYEDSGWIEIYNSLEFVLDKYRIELDVGKAFLDQDVVSDYIKGYDISGRISTVTDKEISGRTDYELQINILKEKNIKFVKYFDLLIKWLNLETQSFDICAYFVKHKYQTVAIYGIGKIGKTLYNKLEKSSVITIAYGIDKSVSMYENLHIYKPTDNLPKADCIVVTINSCFDEIQKKLKETTSIPTINIDEIVSETFKS